MKLFFRILLAALFSPIWLPAYLFVLAMVVVAALAVNTILFVGKGEIDPEIWAQIAEFTTLRMFKQDSHV